MGTASKHLILDADIETVWDAVRDFAQPERLVPGFVSTLAASPVQRVVQFRDGTTVIERLVSVDEDAHRLVYSVIGGRTMHNNSALVLNPLDTGRTRLEWTIDALPDEIVPYLDANMEQAFVAMRTAFESRLA
jgi:carbon monoxide dehydrogenase subunit G